MTPDLTVLGAPVDNEKKTIHACVYIFSPHLLRSAVPVLDKGIKRCRLSKERGQSDWAFKEARSRSAV